MEHLTGGVEVFLSQMLDGIGMVQGVEGLPIVAHQRGVQMGEVVVDVLRHLPVRGVEREARSTKQKVAVFRQEAFHAVDAHAVGDAGHAEGAGHLVVRQRLLLVEHRQQRAQKDEPGTRVERLMGVGYEVGGKGEFPFVGQFGGGCFYIGDIISRPSCA